MKPSRGQEGGVWAWYSGVGWGDSSLLCSSSALELESRIQACCTPQPATSLTHHSSLKHDKKHISASVYTESFFFSRTANLKYNQYLQTSFKLLWTSGLLSEGSVWWWLQRCFAKNICTYCSEELKCIQLLFSKQLFFIFPLGSRWLLKPYQKFTAACDTDMHTNTHTYTRAMYLKLLITASLCFYSHWQFLPHWNVKQFPYDAITIDQVSFSTTSLFFFCNMHTSSFISLRQALFPLIIKPQKYTNTAAKKKKKWLNRKLIWKGGSF